MSSLVTPEAGLAGLFLACFIASSVVPFSSEAALIAFLVAWPEQAHAALAVATAGNVIGGMTSWGIGRLVPARATTRLDPALIARVRRWGAPATFFAWLPIIGDALCAAAGWLRVPWWRVLAWMGTGRFLRYFAIVATAGAVGG